jgi:hypothetical protein
VLSQVWFWFMVFNTTFNNISVISWRLVLLVEETGENYRPVASHWQTLSHNVVLSTLHPSGVRTHNICCDRHWFAQVVGNPTTIRSQPRHPLAITGILLGCTRANSVQQIIFTGTNILWFLQEESYCVISEWTATMHENLHLSNKDSYMVYWSHYCKPNQLSWNTFYSLSVTRSKTPFKFNILKGHTQNQ